MSPAWIGSKGDGNGMLFIIKPGGALTSRSMVNFEGQAISLKSAIIKRKLPKPEQIAELGQAF